ncbi:MoaD/ThiS family protein [Lentilactobacillus farraginis]|uniref:Molybdenum cofactor biosynthesis protein MoaD n=1 Tax=Lentilactobacillus farraginis DSM 18382 = JCM 14108 TaxID=1423743 RepID=X0PFA0_9LACO|nr:MoaD/ThiS family protein [Lentilactobacillus farraginis]KRM07431.1 hypothetical protein FD41_GL000388 [Lentilactobacillus farraginis DSM 18382 = JCM 14108]GAF35497.1 molybdenum cofactor biosynthesis protein MoaD [Lentilactobacillus farraginis DSM 18382 = JCM 14108]
MNLKVKLFAMLQDQFDTEITVTISEPITGSAIKSALIKKLPGSQEIVQESRIAINQEFIDDTLPQTGNILDVAIIPPVSGG